MPETRKPGFSAREAREIVAAQKAASIGQSNVTQVLARKYARDPEYLAARQWCWNMRAKGFDPWDIAKRSTDEFGEKITWPRVEAMIESANFESKDKDALNMRALENARLDWYLTCIADQIAVGNLDAIKTATRISERRSRMNGLDAPAKVHAHITGDVDPTVLEMVQLERDHQRSEIVGRPQPSDIYDAEVLSDETDAEEGYVDTDLAGETPDEEL